MGDPKKLLRLNSENSYIWSLYIRKWEWLASAEGSKFLSKYRATIFFKSISIKLQVIYTKIFFFSNGFWIILWFEFQLDYYLDRQTYSISVVQDHLSWILQSISSIKVGQDVYRSCFVFTVWSLLKNIMIIWRHTSSFTEKHKTECLVYIHFIHGQRIILFK